MGIVLVSLLKKIESIVEKIEAIAQKEPEKIAERLKKTNKRIFG